jgi:hypothetical protein
MVFADWVKCFHYDRKERDDFDEEEEESSRLLSSDEDEERSTESWFTDRPWSIATKKTSWTNITSLLGM